MTFGTCCNFVRRNLIIGATSSFILLGFVSLFQPQKVAQDKDESLSHQNERSVDPQKVSQGARILKYGTPERGDDVRYYANHVLGFNQAKHVPDWVAEHITADHVKGSATRKQSKFKEDVGIADMFRSSNSDYKNSGWSRGHMAPAADSKYSQIAMDDSFLLSNIVPQDIDNNRDFWNRFEMYCRSLTKSFDDVRIISGPLYIPSIEQNGKLYMKYEVIGNNQVAVPTHLYKVVTIENTSSRLIAVGAFIVPNKPISSDHSNLVAYQVPLDDLEKKSGLRFLSKLDLSQTKNLCSVVSCNLMGGKEMEQMFIRKRLEAASNFTQLEKVWKEMEVKKIIPEKFDHELYSKKKYELMKKKNNEL